MDTNIQYKIFPYDPEVHDYELDESYAKLGDYENLKEAFWGGYTDGKAIYIHRFLREDLSINLELLEVAVILLTEYLEMTTPFDSPITLYIDSLKQYYELRGITDKPKNMKEEYYVIRGIIDAVANNVSVKPIKVEYVADTTDPSSGRQ